MKIYTVLRTDSLAWSALVEHGALSTWYVVDDYGLLNEIELIESVFVSLGGGFQLAQSIRFAYIQVIHQNIDNFEYVGHEEIPCYCLQSETNFVDGCYLLWLLLYEIYDSIAECLNELLVNLSVCLHEGACALKILLRLYSDIEP